MADDFWAKYKDSRWQKKRLQIMERDGWTCRTCGDTADSLNGEQLHVHHGYYDRDKSPWEYDGRTLFTLCNSCHKAATSERLGLQFYVGCIEPDYYLDAAQLLDAIARWRDGRISSDEAIFRLLTHAGFLASQDEEANRAITTLGLDALDATRLNENIALGTGASV